MPWGSRFWPRAWRRPSNWHSCAARGATSSRDRKSTRLNSSHLVISYAVFCLKKKKKLIEDTGTDCNGADPSAARASVLGGSADADCNGVIPVNCAEAAGCGRGLLCVHALVTL